MHLRRREGLEVSPCGLGQDHLIEREVGYRSAQPTVLFLQFLKPLQLITVHTAILTAPPVESLLRHTNLTHCFRNAHSLSLKHFNLPKLQDDILCFLSLACHLMVLLKKGLNLTQWVDHFSGGRPNP